MKLLALLVVFLLSVAAFGQNELTLFVTRLAEIGSFNTEVRLDFCLLDPESVDEQYVDFSMRLAVMLNARRDWYFEFIEPEELEGIAMVYLAREDVLFSVVEGEPWKQYRTGIFQSDLIDVFLRQFFGAFLEPASFVWNTSREEDLVLYKIEPNEARIRLLGLLGGGYVPNIMSVEIVFPIIEGRFPIPRSITIRDRAAKEHMEISVIRFSMASDEQLFLSLRNEYYSSFR
ncbi:MAG TPA: hypothetical protein DCE14_02515 [Kosmotogaceae bacterium]|nr:hypothetical protein [Kosmotogaceae bacterium]